MNYTTELAGDPGIACNPESFESAVTMIRSSCEKEGNRTLLSRLRDILSESSLLELHLYRIGPELYVAHDPEDAWKLWEEQTGESRGDYESQSESPLCLVPPEKVIGIGQEGQDEHLSAEQWCKSSGRGFLASSEW